MKISIQGYGITRTEASIRVLSEGRELVTACDIDYESGDASKCCELLAAMRDAGLIELEADENAAKQWASELANGGSGSDSSARNSLNAGGVPRPESAPTPKHQTPK